MSRLHRTSSVRFLVTYLLRVVLRRLAVAAIPLLVVLAAALLTLGVPDLTTPDWRRIALLLVRILITVGKAAAGGLVRPL